MEMKEVAPGVMVPGNSRRVLYDGDPKAADYTAAAEEVEEIRRELSTLRHRLYMLYTEVDRGHMPADSTCLAASGSIGLAIRALYDLIDNGERSFQRRANRLAELWADVEEHPEQYVIEFGKWWWDRDRRENERRHAEGNRDA
jgi:hypothetical protein